MKYIKRTLEKKIAEISKEYACLLLTGPRQVGKSTMLEHLMEGSGRNKVTLDDADERKLAKTDPALFLEVHPAPVLIDEVQYAPELFSYIKIKIDAGAAPGSFWLTGSQMFRMMKSVTESLAGRVGIVPMQGLTGAELDGRHPEPFTVDIPLLSARFADAKPMGVSEYRVTGTLPADLADKLPSVEDLQNRIGADN